MQPLSRHRKCLGTYRRFFATGTKHPATRSRHGRCPGVEHLEPRTLLSAYTMHTLTTFNSFNGAVPFAGVVSDPAGNLYGTTSNGPGTVYEFAHGANAVNTIATIGNYPQAGVIMDSAGDIYGTTTVGGLLNDGTVFEIARGTTTPITLASFNGANGAQPNSTLLLDPNGHLIGTTLVGGTDNFGTVFEIDPANPVIQTLATFTGGNGKLPSAGLVEDAAGNLFGATAQGPVNVPGTIFEIPKATGVLTTIAPFISSAEPIGDLLLDSHGDIFATAAFGGAHNHGTLDELPAGSSAIKTLFSFNGVNGGEPAGGLAMDAGGNLFGTAFLGGARGDGSIFQFNLNTNMLTTLFSFDKVNGAEPSGDLYRDVSGNLYGTTRAGGSAGEGVLFELSPPPAITGFTLINADTGQAIETLANGSTLNLSMLPRDLNIVVDTTGGIINSVLVAYDNHPRYRLSNDAPYTLFGFQNGHYRSQIFTAGQHTISATAWSQLNAKILAARSPALVFNVIDG